MQVTEISDLIKHDLVITEENVVELAETAQMYSCFQNVSRVLTDKCQSYYRELEEESRERQDQTFLTSAFSVASSAASSMKNWIGSTVMESEGSQDVTVAEDVPLSDQGSYDPIL